MKLLAIVGSARKGKGTDSLADRAIAGVRAGMPDCDVTKLNLYDFDIKFCRNCLACRDIQSAHDYVPCPIGDDMDQLSAHVDEADAYVFATPVHMGHAPGIVTTFLERICWTFAKPERRILTIDGCPMPRTRRKRNAVIIVTAGVVPRLYRRFCDTATPLIRQTIADSLNTKTVGDLFAGAIEKKGWEQYAEKAISLGRRLAAKHRNSAINANC